MSFHPCLDKSPHGVQDFAWVTGHACSRLSDKIVVGLCSAGRSDASSTSVWASLRLAMSLRSTDRGEPTGEAVEDIPHLADRQGRGMTESHRPFFSCSWL